MLSITNHDSQWIRFLRGKPELTHQLFLNEVVGTPTIHEDDDLVADEHT